MPKTSNIANATESAEPRIDIAPRLSVYTDNTSDGGENKNNIEEDGVLGVLNGMWMNVNRMIGSGIFATPGEIMYLTGNWGMTLIVYIIGFIYVAIGSCIYTELGSTIPESGGEQIYLERTLPKPEKMFSYIFSFTMLVLIQPTIIVSVSTAAAQYIYYAIYRNNEYSDIKTFNFWEIHLMAFVIITVITLYHLFNNDVARKINETLAIIKTLTLFIVVIIGLSRISKHPERFHKSYLFVNTREGKYFSNYTSSMLKALFAYDGWNNLNYSLDEMKKPEKRLKFSSSSSVMIVGILYILAILALIAAVPIDLGDINSQEVYTAKLGKEIGLDVPLAILIAISCIGVAGAAIWSGSKIITSVAKSKLIPFYSLALEKKHEEWKTPFNALILQWAYLSFILLIPLENTYKKLVDFNQYSILIFYLLCAIGLLALRKNDPNRNRPFRVNITAVVVFILFTLTILIGVFTFSSSDAEDQIWKLQYVISYVVILIGFIFWYLFYYRNLK